MLTPRQPAPDLGVHRLDGTSWSLNEQPQGRFKLIAFYRGLHSKSCGRYIAELDALSEEFEERGVDLWAVSMDDAMRARRFADRHGVRRVAIGWGLDEPTARAWGLFLSSGRSADEPKHFAEPGLFLIDPRLFVYYQSVQNMPFARPSLREILSGIDYALEHDYPARGTYFAA